MGEFDKVLDYKGAVQGRSVANPKDIGPTYPDNPTVNPIAFVPTEVYPQ